MFLLVPVGSNIWIFCCWSGNLSLSVVSDLLITLVLVPIALFSWRYISLAAIYCMFFYNCVLLWMILLMFWLRNTHSIETPCLFQCLLLNQLSSMNYSITIYSLVRSVWYICKICWWNNLRFGKYLWSGLFYLHLLQILAHKPVWVFVYLFLWLIPLKFFFFWDCHWSLWWFSFVGCCVVVVWFIFSWCSSIWFFSTIFWLEF